MEEAFGGVCEHAEDDFVVVFGYFFCVGVCGGARYVVGDPGGVGVVAVGNGGAVYDVDGYTLFGGAVEDAGHFC